MWQIVTAKRASREQILLENGKPVFSHPPQGIEFGP